MGRAAIRVGMLSVVVSVFGSMVCAAEAWPVNKVVAIRAGKLVDVVRGKTLVDQIIIIDGDRINPLGAATTTPVPAGAEVINLTGATALPGLIDVHTHLTGDPSQHGYKSLGISDIRAALYGVRVARLTLAADFTSVRNVGAEGFGDVAMRDAINDGDFIGPRMLVSAYALGIKSGHCDNNLLPHDFEYTGRGVADGPWVARTKVREMVKYGMSNMQAIQAATINAADLMGWKDRVGSLSPGKFADIIAVDEDPAQDAPRLTRVKFVMKGGKVVKPFTP